MRAGRGGATGVGITLGGGAGTGKGAGVTLSGDAGAGRVGTSLCSGGVIASTSGETAASVILVKISLRLLMAANWASPGVLNGELGWGLAMASASRCAACVASSAGDETGTAQRWGKNSTVLLTRSPLVEGR